MNGYDPNGRPGDSGGWQPPPYGGWPPPADSGWQGPPLPPNNPLAITSFVMGLLSIICFSFLSIPGLIVGIISLVQYSRAPYSNRWMAIAGVVLSGLRILLVIAFIGLFLLPDLVELPSIFHELELL